MDPFLPPTLEGAVRRKRPRQAVFLLRLFLLLIVSAAPASQVFGLELSCTKLPKMKGPVKEVTTFSSVIIRPAFAQKQRVSVMRFDLDGRIIQVEEGERSDDTAPIVWSQKEIVTYDPINKSVSITTTTEIPGIRKTSCTLEVAEDGSVSSVVKSNDGTFASAIFDFYENGRRVKTLDYGANSGDPKVVTYEYDEQGILRTEKTKRYKRLLDENHRAIEFQAFDNGVLIAYERMAYNDHGDITRYDHYRPQNILVWTDFYSYVYDSQGNWVEMAHSERPDRKKDGEFIKSSPYVTKRVITYYDSLPSQ